MIEQNQRWWACEHGQPRIKCLQCENAKLTATIAAQLTEIERLRGEVEHFRRCFDLDAEYRVVGSLPGSLQIETTSGSRRRIWPPDELLQAAEQFIIASNGDSHEYEFACRQKLAAAVKKQLAPKEQSNDAE